MKTKPIPETTASAPLSTDRILVPVDFSGTEYEALAYAVPLAKNLGAKIVLLHVIEPSYAGAAPGLAYLPPLNDAPKKRARERMRSMAAGFIPKDMFEKAIVRMGSPYHEITSEAGGLNAGMIVIATHGRTGLSHLLIGSTAERVVRHAPCPVLTVRGTEGLTSGLELPPQRRVRRPTHKSVACTTR